MSSISSSQSTGFPIFLKKDEIRVICFSFPVSQERFSSLFLIISGATIFFRADRSLGAKQEGLSIVHFLNKWIVSCKEAVRFPFYFFFFYLYARLETGHIMWLGIAGRHPHRFQHNNISSVYRIFTKLSHMIGLWKGKNPIYFGVIRSKVTVTINRIFDNRVVSAR